MAPEAPDPKSFKSWEEAFEYPIPAVRSMEKQLRRDIESNREKLRTLVGASYRDLLGTAGSIIEMDSQMQNVEVFTGEIGRRCNSKMLEKKGSNLNIWRGNVEAPNTAHYKFASQLAILRSCPDIIARLLKRGESVLLAAKILVISRLLHTRLCQRSNPPPYLEKLRSRLASLRRRLLVRIDHCFQRLDIERSALIDAMGAFSLSTSSSAQDALRHYHHIRQEVVFQWAEKKDFEDEKMLVALRLYIKTLKDTQAIIPNQLSHALIKLKATPLIQDSDVCGLAELNLDIHERWIDSDVKTFIPYIRHDDLSKTEAERLLKQWARETFSSFLGGLRTQMESSSDPLTVMKLRQQVLDLWLSNHRHSIGLGSAESLDGLRDVFNLQYERLIQSRVSNLTGTGAAAKDLLHAWQPNVYNALPSLWDPSMTSMDVSKGAKPFQESLAARSYGKTEPLNRFTSEYRDFLDKIEDMQKVIKKIRETKWSADIEEVDNVDEVLDNKQVLLGEDDPNFMQDKLNDALVSSYIGLQSALSELHPDSEDENCSQKSCFILRLWREIRQHLPQSYQNSEIGFGSILALQKSIANALIRPQLKQCDERIQKLIRKGNVSARSLWDGDPPLPILPSTWTYRLLLDLSTAMAACGSDVWSPQATEILKETFTAEVVPLIEKVSSDNSVKINGHMNGEVSGDADMDEQTNTPITRNPIDDFVNESKETRKNGAPINGTAKKPSPTHQSQDLKIQTLFDINYLVSATGVKGVATENNKLVSLQERLSNDLGLEAKLMERVRKDAIDYWKRTSLLFGLLS